MMFKHGKGTVVLTQTQHPASGMAKHASGLEHQLLHDRFDAPAFCRMAHGRVGGVQGMLANQAQQVHGYRGELADQVVGVELARGQALKIHVAFELRVKLLMRGMVTIQGNDVLSRKRLGQSCGPAFQNVLRKQQQRAALVDGALGQAKDSPNGVGSYAHVDQLQRVLPDALALACAIARPEGAGVLVFLTGKLFDRSATGIPFNDEGDLAFKLGGLCSDFLHQFQRTKPRVCAHQQRRLSQARRHGQDTLKVVLRLAGRVLLARTQSQLQAIPQAAHIHGQRAVAVYPCIGAPNQLFLAVAVIHGEGVKINGHVATIQDAEINIFTVDARTQELLVQVRHQVKPTTRMCVKALTQGGARGHRLQAQSTDEEIITTESLDRIKVIFAQTKKPEIRFQDVAVRHARAHRKGPIEHGVEFDRFEILTDKCQTGMRTKVVGQFFDKKFSHRNLTCRVRSIIPASY